MNMRVSSNEVFDGGLRSIQKSQFILLSTQNHISTGKRVLTPADDPVAAARILELKQSSEVNNRHMENQGYASDQLNLLETKLSDATDTVQGILELATQAGNSGTQSDADRRMIATDLRQRLAQLLATANSQDANGQYMFAGFQSNTQPFSPINDPVDANIAAAAVPHNATNSYVTYSGDQGQRQLQVEASRVIPMTENGHDLFMRLKDKNGNLTSGSVFDALKNMIDTLEKPISTNATFQTDLSNAKADVQAFLDNTLRIRASVGYRLSELDALGSSGSALNLQYQQTMSGLADLDYADAISTFSKQQMQLQAAQQSFLKISGLSLFNLL